jgi:hypothetical protein
MNAEVKLKKFVVIPRDALECLTNRHGTLDEATGDAEARCAETGMTTFVIELKAVAARADRPVKVRKL